MATLAEFRAQYPQYAEVPDGKLAISLHRKFYADTPMVDYLGKLGLDRQALIGTTGSPEDDQYLVQQLERPGANETPEQAAARYGGVIQKREPGLLENLGRAFVQGGMFGFGDEAVAAGAAALNPDQSKSFGEKYDTYRSREIGNVDQFREDNPVAAYGTEIAGAIPTAIATGGATNPAYNLIGRMLQGGAVGAGQGAVYGFGAGEGDVADRGKSAVTQMLLGGAVGTAAPAALSAIGAGVEKVAPMVGTIVNPAKEALRRTGVALGRDANAGGVMSAADEATAATNNIPLINADRGGETTRALARSVSNQSPEARAVIEKTASDRFAGQGGRAVEFLRRVTGGAVDDLGYQQSIRDTARKVNEPLYRQAYSSPEAADVFTPEISELMQSDRFRKAVQMAESRGTDKAAIAGTKAVKNPFVIADDGTFTLKPPVGGEQAKPTLEFWNQVKINLDSMIDSAKPTPLGGGDRALYADLTQLKQKLVGALDSAVPEYKAARASAASYFGAEDALDAGKKFANSMRNLPEATKAFASMSPAEQAAFRVGYASELIDKIKSASDRVNVINQTFAAPAKREMFELVFGKGNADELGKYVGIETQADKLRGALGNSTTARQLMELGIGGAGGYGISGGDWRGALAGALLARGGRALTQRADAKVMQEVAKLLTANDPQSLQRAMQLAATRPAVVAVLKDAAKAIPGATFPISASNGR